MERFDTAGNVISVNSVVGITPNTGTTYDGMTPLLTAKQKVQPDQIVSAVFSVQDLGDSIYDSAGRAKAIAKQGAKSKNLY